MRSIHLEAEVGEIAETVLLPGDPLRAKFVAENYLTEVKCYNKVRNMFGFTGLYKGERVSIQGTGMGMGSAGIYIHELINTYQCKNLIRVGTCGSIQENLDLGQVLLVTAACGDSDANSILFQNQHFAPTASFELLLKAHESAKEQNIKVHPGLVFSTNTFYDLVPNRWDVWKAHGVLGIDMETEILYTMAARFGVNALSLLTVSDNILTGQASSQEEREKTYNEMMEIALSLI
ncbi:purine-nucleoside phosphorylase [Leadbetterella byssophila]|uniref:Uridine phosphorylase n=1 Tax=Leadbetterella byssophila (strain DSM 17132 / JCM 16389 / KACC 11308 / NBRC 106382 / 4M15) TaxID=649349 RepID=E4RU29_LEAB4|nr:purine-nucleoside phosphorylase [Leadbetterella byssophila]ADQ16010.1 purine-nucleoside phosphorylase [Leadbetterella byssophila DSM 17132]